MKGPSLVWRSALPRFLKAGVAGAAGALANSDGTFDEPLTVERLVLHDYDGRSLKTRAVQYQLRMLEAAGVLVIPDSTAPVGRGYARDYWFNYAALATIDPAAPYFREMGHQKGAAERVQQKGAAEGCSTMKKGAEKGAEKGAAEGCSSATTPFSCTDLISISNAEALRAPVEKSAHKTPDPKPQQLTLGPHAFTPVAVRAYHALDATARARLEQDARKHLHPFQGFLGREEFERRVQDQVRLYLEDARVRQSFKVG